MHFIGFGPVQGRHAREFYFGFCADIGCDEGESTLCLPGQQIATETWSGRKDVPPPQGYKPILSYQVANDYKAFMTNEAQIAELRKKFEGYTGPVVNSGGVR